MAIQEYIRNYYEKLVSELLDEKFKDSPKDIDELTDIACIALNRLPSRYFRHEIDMAFYLSQHELQEMQDRVSAAIDEAIERVESSQRN